MPSDSGDRIPVRNVAAENDAVHYLITLDRGTMTLYPLSNQVLVLNIADISSRKQQPQLLCIDEGLFQLNYLGFLRCCECRRKISVSVPERNTDFRETCYSVFHGDNSMKISPHLRA